MKLGIDRGICRGRGYGGAREKERKRGKARKMTVDVLSFGMKMRAAHFYFNKIAYQPASGFAASTFHFRDFWLGSGRFGGFEHQII